MLSLKLLLPVCAFVATVSVWVAAWATQGLLYL